MRRYGRSGWYGERHRHYLAAKGIKTKPIDWKSAPKGAEYDFYGIDSKGRRVRLYGKEHKQKVDTVKFKRVEQLDKKYSAVEARLKQDIDAKDETKRENARAAYVIFKTGLRPGTDKDTKGDVQAFGVTTLEPKTVKVSKDKVRFKFVGKKGVNIDKSVKDPTLKRIVTEQKRESKEELFPNITDDSVRRYIGKMGNYKTKDLRTLYANRLAKKLKKQGKPKKEIVETVAYELQNTPGVAKGAYIEPKVLQ